MLLRKLLKESNKTAIETVENFKTVLSLKMLHIPIPNLELHYCCGLTSATLAPFKL